MTFESKMNLKSIPVCSKSIKITAILVTFLRWLQYSWNWYNHLSFSVRKSSLNHTKAEVSMEITFQTCGFVLIFEYIHSCVILQSFSYPFYRFVTAISTFLNYIFSTVKITNLCIWFLNKYECIFILHLSVSSLHVILNQAAEKADNPL